MLVIRNDDRPGVIGEVGTILGRHELNIANFTLGRGETGAIGVVNVDEHAQGPNTGVVTATLLDEIARVEAIQTVRLIRLS